jgi:hypothetical protein
MINLFMNPYPVLEVKEIPARKVDEGCEYFQQKQPKYCFNLS